MTNPIQTVLNAEATALQEIKAEEKAAEARRDDARQHARQILQRNEARTARIAKRYEAFCERDLAGKIDALIEESEKELEQFSHLSSTDRQAIVESVFAMLVPSEKDSEERS